MDIENFKKGCMLIFLLTLCVLLCGCQALFPEEHTELVEDGKYRPFEDPKKNIEKLMELVEAEDADYIYDVFSPAIRENTEDLYGQIQEFIRFSKESVKEWDYVKWNGSITRDSGAVRAPRISRNHLNVSSGIYRCEIKEVLNDTAHEDAMGFSYILIFPEELSAEYASKEPSGFYVVYRAEDWPPNVTIDPNPMETLMQLTTEGNADSIYEMFSLTAKRNDGKLQEKTTELLSFLSEQVSSWEAYTWTQNIEDFNQSAATTREMLFYLHTDNGLYRCDIREVLESTNQADVGVTSISIFPALYPGERPPFEAEVYRGYCTWGCENTGISIFQ